MLSLALLLIVFYSLHLFLKWLLGNNRGKWVAITLFILHRIMYLMIYVFNWVIIVNAILNRTELLIALVFTLPMAWYMGKVCLHDINMPQRVQWYPFFGRYFIFFKWKIIQWEYKDKDEFTIY